MAAKPQGEALVEGGRVLSPDGRLSVTLTDQIDRILARGTNKNHDRLTGMYASSVTVPGEGTFEHPTTFWTVAFARYVTEQRFTLRDSRIIDDKPTHFLIFSPGQRT